MKTFQGLAAVGLLFSAVACGGAGKAGGQVENPSGKKDRSGNMVSKEAARGFSQAIDGFQASDKAGSWTEAECKQVAGKFIDASEEQESAGGNKLPEALYNAGLAHQRCGDDVAAKEQFQAALAAEPEFHRARAQLALYKLKESGDVDSAITELDQIIRDAKFQNYEALVSLAALQMQRGSSASGPGCENDLACAQLNLQRALALNDAYMPASNQLALYYLEQARAKSGGPKKKGLVVSTVRKGKVNSQQLDLAALVASQAQHKNPKYAPLHNTTGLILVELQNYNGAVKAFGTARKLDPKFFEAHMNYAAVNLSFRGFAEAEKAYRDALKLRPDTYEAQLGLALALRGQINDSNYDKFVGEAQKALDAAKKLDPQRPEAYYNEAILFQEFRAKRIADDAGKIKEFAKAIKQYESFIGKAGGDSEYAEAVKRSEGRVQDIKDTIQFMEEGIELEKAAKEDEARRKAEEEAAKKAAEEEKKAAEAEKKSADEKGKEEKPDATAPAKK